MTQIGAEVIADTLNGSHRLTSLVLTMPRMILAEFNTHRMLSRSSASSRAIPIKKMIDAVESDPFIPHVWLKTHPGMQGTEVVHEDEAWHCKNTWLVARDHAVYQAKLLSERYHVTKQICNRLLEPFMWHKVIATATEWENFIALRAHEDAENHMQLLAHAILNSLNQSVPRWVTQDSSWHIPFGDQINDGKLTEALFKISGLSVITAEDFEHAKIDIAVARCAQISYTLFNEEGKEMDYEKLLRLTTRLKDGGHWSPFEHVAKAMNIDECHGYYRGDTDSTGWYGNFRGFKQYRKTFRDENRGDFRLIDKGKLSLTTK